MDTIFGKQAEPELFSARNGLLLAHHIEKIFDNGKMAIVPYISENTSTSFCLDNIKGSITFSFEESFEESLEHLWKSLFKGLFKGLHQSLLKSISQSFMTYSYYCSNSLTMTLLPLLSTFPPTTQHVPSHYGVPAFSEK